MNAVGDRARRRRPAVLAAGALAVAALMLSSCSLQTLGSKAGSLTLRADFPDAEGLVVGNTVQASNVVVGSVQHIALDGYRAAITLSIADGHPIPAGTSATITQTSLLGEYFVDLIFPPGFDPAHANYLSSGARLTDTSTEPDVEHLAGEVGQVVSALDAGDVSSIIKATAQALAGRGPELHTLVGELADLSQALQSQDANIATVVDDLGHVGSTLAPLSPQVGSLIDSLASSTTTITQDRQKLISALSGFNALAQQTNDVILAPHQQQFLQLTTEANAILGVLLQNGAIINELFDNFALFVPHIEKAVSDAQLLVFTWADPGFVLPSASKASAASAPGAHLTSQSGTVPLPAYMAGLLR